jgi:hypothetical protein
MSIEARATHYPEVLIPPRVAPQSHNRSFAQPSAGDVKQHQCDRDVVGGVQRMLEDVTEASAAFLRIELSEKALPVERY